MGIEPPPRGADDSPLTILGFTPVQSTEPVYIPSLQHVDLNVSVLIIGQLKLVRTGGQSTRPRRPDSRVGYDQPLELNVRVVINEKNRVFRDLMLTVEDEALVAETKDVGEVKGSRGFLGIGNTLRTEYQTTYTNIRRTGAVLDFNTFYQDNEADKTFAMDVGVEFEGTYYKVGTITREDPLVTINGFVAYTNPNDLSSTAIHRENLSRPNLADGSPAPVLTFGTESAASTCSVRYTYTFYNIVRDIESAPSLSSEPIAIDATQSIRLTNFDLPGPNSSATHIRLYRICPEKGETAFTLIATIPLADEAPTHIDNLGSADLGGLKYNNDEQLVYERRDPVTGRVVGDPIIIVNADGTRHNINDGFDEQWNKYVDAGGRILDTYQHNPPPSINGRYVQNLIKIRGTLVGVIDSRIYWSMTGFPDYWPAQNFIDLRERITEIHPISEGVLVFTNNETHLITDFPNDPVRTVVATDQGCIGFRTIKDLRGNPVWLSNDGVCTYVNGSVEVISRNRLGSEYLRGNVITTEVHDDVYYILYDNRIVSMDQRFTTVNQNGTEVINTNFVEYDRNGVRWFEKFTDDDTFYGVTDDNQIVEMFAGSEDLEMEYLSGVITLVGESRIKRFNKLYVAYDDRGGLGVQSILYNISNRTRVITHTIDADSSVIERDLPTDAFYGIQFRVTGKGEVSAIDFTTQLSEAEPTS